MSRLHLLTPALAIALLFGCKDKPAEQADDKSAAKVEPGKATPEPAKPADTAAPPADETTGGGETDTGEAVEPPPPLPEEFEQVGVDVCDDYVSKYVACIGEKVPEAEREAQRRIVFDNVTAWKQTAAGGAAAEKGLQTACKIATEQAKRATQEWGCEW